MSRRGPLRAATLLHALPTPRGRRLACRAGPVSAPAAGAPRLAWDRSEIGDVPALVTLWVSAPMLS